MRAGNVCTKKNCFLNIILFFLLMGVFGGQMLLAAEYTPTTVQVSSEIAGWPGANLNDNNNSTCWSSIGHPSQYSTEWVAYWWSGFQNVNYIKVYPRMISGAAACFPVNFDIYYSNGSSWVLSRSVTSFPVMQHSAWIILQLPSTVSANGIYITATRLRGDNYGNYYFQLGEVKAGYDAGFNKMRFIGYNGATPAVQIQGSVGSDSFNPNKLTTWHKDVRHPLLTADQGGDNIYAANIVYNGTWNIYFGGWNSPPPADKIWIKTTNDWQTFSSSYLQVSEGTYQHANNPSVVKLGTTNWRMLYTILNQNTNKNITGYSTSTNGASWTPSAASSSYLVSIAGYDQANADINGGNVIYYENGTYHLYFTDFTRTLATHYATSTNGVSFTYIQDAQSHQSVPNDMKMFSYSGTNYYVLLNHKNSNYILRSISTDKTTFGAPNALFYAAGPSDAYMTSAGFVTKNNRIMGVLYGGTDTSTMMQNKIFARWLQKAVVFTNSYQSDGVNDAYGPDIVRMPMAQGNNDVETGVLSVYDSDGTTLLFTSPQITIRQGDIYSYNP